MVKTATKKTAPVATTWKLASSLANGPLRPGRGDREVVYTYLTIDGAKMVQFHAHPTRSFSYVIVHSRGASASEPTAVIEAFMVAGMDQHKFKGGFAEAIATVTTK